MRELIFLGSWDDILHDYDGSPTMILNGTDRSQDAITQSLKRYFDGEVRVISRKRVLYLNPPVKSVTRVPGILYFEGDWDFLYDMPLKQSQLVINLSIDHKRNCDFVKRLNEVLADYGFDGFEAMAVKGKCVLGTSKYFDNPDWRGDW